MVSNGKNKMSRSPEFQSWINAAALGWEYGERGYYEQALEQYELADALAKQYWPETPFWLNPKLSMLRHKTGKAEGYVRTYAQTEDVVVAIEVDGGIEESIPEKNMTRISLSVEGWAERIKEFTNHYSPERHILENTNQDAEHVMVMSTGRCGTVALLRLFQQSNLMPYHSYFLNLSFLKRFEMLCSLHGGMFSSSHEIADTWARTRAAEWIGAENQGQNMIGLNHMDTIFAPVFAAIHPNSRFIHLRRDPVEVFKSFIQKDQWNHTQLCPCQYKTMPFKWARQSYDLPYALAWYIRFTEVFAEAMRWVLPQRVYRVSSNGLFEHDGMEVGTLKVATNIHMDTADIHEHFNIKHNEKAHKTRYTEEEIEPSVKAFKQYYTQLGGRL